MAYNLDKILCITLLCLLLYSRGEMKLKFNQSLQEVTEKYLVDDAINNLIKLECRTNKLASFTWQDCYYHSENIYDPLIYASCEELYAANTCRNIPERNNLFIDPSPTESSLKSSLRHYVMVPKTGGCIGCFASSGNETIRSFTKYYFKDCCGAPDQRDATFWDADCGTRDIPCGLSEKQFQLKCKIGEPEEVSVIEELNEEGKLDLILRWKDSSRNGHYRPFGYEIEVDEAYDHSCRRLTTKYSNFTASTSAPGYHEYKLLGKPSLKIYFNHKYEIKIRTLPFSEWVKINITTRSGRELCDEYYKKTGKRPSRCFMIDNVMVSNCTADKSVTVSWTINQTFPDDVINVTYLENSRKNSIYWEFDKTNTSITFENVTKPFTIWMFMRKKNLEMLNIQEFQQISCQEPTLTPTKLSTTMKKTVLDTAVIYAVVIGSILFSLVLLSIIIYFGLRKVRTDLVGFNRLLSKEGNEVTMEIGSTSDDKRALIVYPQGCYEVEKLVLFLVKQLNCIGIYPLTDLTQGQRVGEEGETVVMINDFEKATYIIILCTDGLYEFENHKMYNFIMKDLVTADCVHKNSSRYAALYFKKSHRVVPPHLLGRSYAMPNDFRRLLMYFLGVGTFARIYEMLLDTVIGQIDSRYSELKGLVEQLNHSFHKQCDISQCRKGRANMLTEPNVLIKNGKKTREDTPSHDSGIHQMGSMLFGSQESINSKPRGSIDDDEEGIDSERDKLFKEEEL